MTKRIMPMAQNRERRMGLTATQLVVIICAVILVLAVSVMAPAGIGIWQMAVAIDEGNIARAKADIKSLTDASSMFKSQHSHRWPKSIDELFSPPDDGGPTTPYLKNMDAKLSPWKTLYQYDPSGQNNQGLQPDVWCVMPNGKKIGNWSTRVLNP